MKILHTILILSVICIIKVSPQPTQGLIAYYPFNGNANDESGNGKHGTLQGSYEIIDGIIGNAFRFVGGFSSDDSLGGHVLLPNFHFSSLNNFSYSLWVKEESITAGAEHYISFRDDLFGVPYAGIAHAGYGDEIHFQVGVTSTNAAIILPYQQSYTNNWVHYCLVYDQGMMKAYINGILLGQKTQTAIVDGIYSAVARHWYNIYTTTRFTGIIDEVRIYSCALSDEQVLEIYNQAANQFGTLDGEVSVEEIGLAEVTVKLLNEFGMPVNGINDQYTDENGQYFFIDVPTGNYQVMIVEPLGYIVNQNPKQITVVANDTSVVNFELTEIVVVNNARSKGYWKHQFDVYITGKGIAQESQQDLENYINLVHQHYTPHFNVFSALTTFEDWQGVLSLKGNHPMDERAKQHLSALVLNMISNKVGQYTTVTEDDRDVGDVVQYVSELILDGFATNDELAKILAESINNQQIIEAGLVPEGSILFKLSKEEKNNHLDEFILKQNYPNPFNPISTIRYDIPKTSLVNIKIFDILGSEVVTLLNEEKSPGSYEIEWNASKYSSGVYFYQIYARPEEGGKEFWQVKKMVYLK